MELSAMAEWKRRKEPVVGRIRRLRRRGLVRALGHRLKGRLGVGLVDGGDLVRRDGVHAAEQRRDHQTDGGQRTRDPNDKFPVDLHFCSASFVTPKRVGFVCWSMIQTVQFISRME